MDATTTETRRPRGAARAVLIAIVIVGILLALVQLVLGGFGQIFWALSGTVGVPVMFDATLPGDPGAVADITVPAEATVPITGASGLLTAMVLGGRAIALVGGLLILLGVVLAAVAQLRGRGFAASARRGLGWVAIGLACTAALAPALDGWASMLGSELLGRQYFARSIIDPQGLFMLLVVGGLALVFQIAERMQRETDGLV